MAAAHDSRAEGPILVQCAPFLMQCIVSGDGLMSVSNAISADDFQALEQKVLRAVGVLRHERETRAAAEAEVQRLRGELTELREQHAAASESASAELLALREERAAVKQRVEIMLHQMDELM